MSTKDVWNQLGEQNVAIGQIGILFYRVYNIGALGFLCRKCLKMGF